MTAGQTIHLPEHVQDVFARLSRGYHLSPSDGDLFRDLEANEAAYRTLFAALGFELSDGVGGFYYFRPGDALNRGSSRAAVFVLVLAQYLADEGQDPVQAFDEIRILHFSEMPHLLPQYRYICEQAGLDSPDAVRNVILNTLVGLGFAERVGDDAFRFRRPIRRFIDQIMALRLLEENAAAGSGEAAEEASGADGEGAEEL